MLLVPSSAKADATTIADWQFSTLYENTSTEGSTYYYTPNTSGEYVGMGHFWYSANTPVFYPQTYVNGTQTDYYMTAASPSRYWQIGQSGKTFLSENSVANEITDYTDASSHKTYVELGFPTTGYKDIQLNFSYHSHNGITGIKVVVSPDGGTTWLEGEEIAAPSSQTVKSVSLAVPNKTSVKVRLLCENGKVGYSYYGYLTVKGTQISSETFYTGSVDVDDASHGSVLISPAGGTYENGSSVTVTAINKTGWAFKEWQIGGSKVSEENPYTFTITENTSLTAIYQKAPIPAGTEVDIVEWTFNTPYSNSANIYTPIAGDFAETDLTSASQLRPNNYLNAANATSYMGVNWTTTGGQYKTRINYANEDQRCLALINSSNANNIDDYTDKNKHDGYFEASFSTRGFDHVGISFVSYRNANGASGTTPAVHVAYSVDGGSTWTDAGETSISGNWWVPTTITPTVSIDDKAVVIVRVFPNNDHAGYWYIDNFLVTGQIATTSVTISDAKYATYYNSVPVVLPADLQAATIDGETSGTLTLNYRYAEGDVIPGGTPVLLKASVADDYTLTYAPNIATSVPAGNLLYGSDTETTTTGGGAGAKYYALQNGANGLGFYWMVDDGAAFESGAHKAWLALPAATPAPFFTLDGGETTSISEELRMKSEESAATTEWYTLDGRRVQPSNLKKGLYIVNGRKVVIK